MPEGHIIHRLADTVSERFGGHLVASSSPQGRFREEATRLDGRRLGRAEAYGKHLLVGFAGLPERVHVHMGLAGRFTFGDGRAPEPSGVIRWRMTDRKSYADLRGPAACELFTPEQVAALVERLGPDPLRADAEPERGWTRLHRSKKSVASLLMDQRIVAGVGNIFRAEVLFRHRIDPMLEGRALARPEWDALWSDLGELMRRALAARRIDTVLPEHLPEAMGRPPRVDRHGGEVYVYRRDGQRCYVCGSVIATELVEGRNLFFCPKCQRARRRRVS